MDEKTISRMNELREKVMSARKEIHKRIVGDEPFIDIFFTCFLSSGLDFHPHILFEGVAGVGKTTILKTIARVLNVRFERVDGNSELLPSDIAGSETIDLETRKKEILKGPVFTNLLFIDEFNRLNNRTRAVLLQPMQEGEVTIGKERFALEEPFMVMGTQNPTSYRSTDFLEPQERDRFMAGAIIGYPSEEEHVQVVHLNVSEKTIEMQSRMEAPEVLELKDLIREHIGVGPAIESFAVRFVRELDPKTASWNVGEKIEAALIMRGSIALVIAARTYAFLRGSDFVRPQDIRAVAPYVVQHRLVPRWTLSQEELSAVVDTAFQKAVHHAARRS
jgi:MoxR-like ATPase